MPLAQLGPSVCKLCPLIHFVRLRLFLHSFTHVIKPSKNNRETSTMHSALLFRMNKSSLGMARIDEAIPWDDCPYAKSNANTLVRPRAYRVFRPRVSGSTSGAPLGAFGTLGVPPQLIPPHSVQKPYNNSPSSSNATLLFRKD